MQYRKFGALNWQVSALGLGLAGLARLEAEDAVAVIRAAVDNGINLIDSGDLTVQKGGGVLAASLQKALSGRRDKVKIMAAIPAAEITAPGDFETALQRLLERLGATGVDFLTLGGLNRFTWADLPFSGVLKQAEKAISAGKIQSLGFSFHDQYQFLRDIIQAYDNWTFCLFDYSFMDIDHHPGYGGVKLAADSGLAVVAVKLLLGGRLERNIPEPVARVWAEAEPHRSPTEWGLRWVWNHPEIACAVSDMYTADMVKSFSAIAGDVLPDIFTVAEELVIGKARDAYRALKPIPCTACRGCMPCPSGIDIPRIFEIFNDASMYGDAAGARALFHYEKHDLTACNECSSCSANCGKQIPIADWLKKARSLLADGK